MQCPRYREWIEGGILRYLTKPIRVNEFSERAGRCTEIFRNGVGRHK